ncbi:unnamed protein product [Scytosiphon promiscuus]
MGSDEWEELLGSAVRKRVVVDGDGDSPGLGSLVLFSWKGNILVNDESGETFAQRNRVTARIGDGDEVPGVELGLRHMRVGQTCLVRCESRFGYGGLGCPATRKEDTDLPPDSDIEVQIELLEVVPTSSAQEMSPEEIIEEGERKKRIGNEHFQRSAYQKALRAYTSAANSITGLELSNESSQTFLQARQLRIDCGNNIATTCARLGELDKAKEAAVDVLELDPANTKALFRAGQVSSLQSNFVEAKLALQKAYDLNPASKEVHAELSRLSARIKLYKSKRRAMQETMGRSLFAASASGPGDQGTNVSAIAAEEAIREENRDERGAGLPSPHELTREEEVVGYPRLQRYKGCVIYMVVALAAWGVTQMATRLVITPT